jgi:arginyl-tRNA synthetase
MERYAKLAVQALNQVLEVPVSTMALETPPDQKLGDFAFPCFKLAKQYRKAPPQVAQQLVAELQAKRAIPAGLQAFATGPYVNFLAPASEALGSLLKDILTGTGLGTYSQIAPETRGTWVLEYSSPNIAKPFQIYHLRPTALGAALDRIGRFRGYNVFSINHLGDWGTQYGKLAVAFNMYGNDLPPEPTIKDLVSIYIKFHEDAKERPELEDEAREAFMRLEQGDPGMTKLWKSCVDIALREFSGIYDRLGVKFDHIWGESHYKNMTTPLIEDLRKRGLLVESEGALVVPLTDRDGKELPPCILQKKDGATIYATRDVAAALYRFQQFHFDRMTYIVGAEQKLHFQQVFGVLRKMGCSWEAHCEHIPTGLYRFKDAKMSTRKGNFVTLEDVLSLAKERVISLMTERAKTQDAPLPKNFEEIIEAVSIGAVLFHDLHTDPARDVEFDLERVVDFDGETGPYLQYAHTRCLSILRKAHETGELKGHAPVFEESLIVHLKAPEELALVKTLGQLSLNLERSLSFAKASQLAHYMIDVTKAFSMFYRECHVLGEAPELTRARLMLVEATRRILGRGLGLLGIPLPERM